jgi:hypothetical protein
VCRGAEHVGSFELARVHRPHAVGELLVVVHEPLGFFLAARRFRFDRVASRGASEAQTDSCVSEYADGRP